MRFQRLASMMQCAAICRVGIAMLMYKLAAGPRIMHTATRHLHWHFSRTLGKMTLTLRALATVVAALVVSTECSSNLARRADGSNCPNTLTTSYPAPVAAPGWEFSIALNGFKKPRSILFDNDGGLLVLDAGVGVYRSLITADDGGTCVLMSPPEMVIELPEVSFSRAVCRMRAKRGANHAAAEPRSGALE